MFAADAARRRKARTGLILAAALPVLVLTPTAIGSSPPEVMPTLLVAAAVWLALAMAYTSFILARAGEVRTVKLIPHRSETRRHVAARSHHHRRGGGIRVRTKDGAQIIAH